MAGIVVLAWDFLVSEPGGLPVAGGKWSGDGPSLPLELSRVTPQWTLALSLCRGAEPSSVFWAYLEAEKVSQAVWLLSQRLGCQPENVGFLDLESGEFWCRTVDEHVETIRRWAEEKNQAGEDIRVIIWSDLKPDFEKRARRELTPENVIAYLKGLRPEVKDKAREYIRNIPTRIRTPILDAVRAAEKEIWD